MSSDYSLLAFNFSWFLLAFIAARYFLISILFSDQEIKSELNKHIFSTTFGMCVLMLVMFIQEVVHTVDKE